ncbi:hypothetical protein Acaty_c1123 [Acidithiobacillus caldus ATCC 51756]|uniref:Uncharacterized protein n=1 Tax=Acidithiobacillus caldus (strain ATCC 51756 / DSM 8584 / KU) TaxID=637389 RepID=A0A059ZU33_ACICK|nr:hypothetical protein Acaty_c1123 [Acidithiobacillus caldus ATCC 51756]QER44761.1 hypothetical protein F0726_01692 [Acidithiobacillus caldus]
MWKTLFGDRYTVAVVLLTLVLNYALLRSPWAYVAAYTFPAILMAGIVWMAWRQGE